MSETPTPTPAKPGILATIKQFVGEAENTKFPALLLAIQQEEAAALAAVRRPQLANAIKLLRDIQKAQNAIKPKTKLLTSLEPGAAAQEFYEPAQLKDAQKLKEQHAKVMKALEAAEKDDWNLIGQLKDMKVTIGPEKPAEDEPKPTE